MANRISNWTTKISPFRNSPRNHAIDTITIHCVVGQMSVESLCSHFQVANCSCNWAIGFDGQVAEIVPEGDRSWCSSSPANDHRAVTIECASDAFYPYAINANVWKTLIGLCADICQRYNIKKLVWSADKSTRVNHLNGCNLTVHRDYANKSCPGDYIYNRLGQIAKEVNQKLGGAPAGPFKAYQGQVNATDDLNCLTAQVSGQVLKTYPDGTVLAISREQGNWGFCGEGWVCLDYITKIASAKDLAAKEESIMEGKQFKKLFDEMRQQWRDNDASAYSEEARKWAVDSGLIAGGSTESFNGMWEDLMTREQLVTVLYRFAQMMGAVPASDNSK